MVRVTITSQHQGTISAKFMTAAILSTIEPVYPLQSSIVGVRVKDPSGEYWIYYCKQHREDAKANAQEITLAEAAHEVAWCQTCRTVLYLNPDDREWATLRDKLCQDDYSQVEIYTSVERDVYTHRLISFQRLVPGALEIEVLFPEGAFDYKDAFRDRREIWPNTIYVSDKTFDRELTKRSHLATGSRQCGGYINTERGGWQLCGAAMATTCYQCYRPICETHQDQYTYYGEKEPTVICSACREEIRAAYGK